MTARSRFESLLCLLSFLGRRFWALDIMFVVDIILLGWLEGEIEIMQV